MEKIGFGAVFNNNWLFQQWEPNFLKDNEPSVEYLELFALVAGILSWSNLLKIVG